MAAANDQVLSPSGDKEVALVVQTAQVTGAQPAMVQRAFGLSQVAWEYRRPAHADLAVAGDTHLHGTTHVPGAAWNGGALQVGQRNDAGGFGHTVGLVQIQPGGLSQLVAERRWHRRATGNHETQGADVMAAKGGVEHGCH
ncbi:hypothetical protein D3C81_1873540 [compost metagenome]